MLVSYLLMMTNKSTEILKSLSKISECKKGSKKKKKKKKEKEKVRMICFTMQEKCYQIFNNFISIAFEATIMTTIF